MARYRSLGVYGFVLFILVAVSSIALRGDEPESLLKQLKNIKVISSTVPENGDLNPYGIVEVHQSVGKLVEGHVLISNFNNKANQQGTGTTIVDVDQSGAMTLFAQIDPKKLPSPCPGGVGLTTALTVLRTGWVIVGSLPTTDGTSATAQPGCLLVLNSEGEVVETFFGTLINGPWDMTSTENSQGAHLFVTMVLNGTVAGMGKVVNQGTVLRIDLNVSQQQMPSIQSMTVIGSGFSTRTDPSALVIGPTGVGLGSPCEVQDKDDCTNGAEPNQTVLYVADTLNNRVMKISDPLHRTTSAGTGIPLSVGGSLNGPLGLTVAPNGNVLTVNGGDGFITEISPQGRQLAKKLLDNTGGPPPGAGALFGVTFIPNSGVWFVDDASNTVNALE